MNDLDQTAYNSHIDDYCEKIKTLKSKFVKPDQFESKTNLCIIPGGSVTYHSCYVKSYDGKWYKIINDTLQWPFKDYEFTRNSAQEYYDQRIENSINETITAFTASKFH